MAPLVVMNTNKASWQANGKREEVERVLIEVVKEEDQDGDPGPRTSP